MLVTSISNFAGQFSEDSKPPYLPAPGENIQPVNVNERDIKRVLIVKNEQQTMNQSIGQLRPQNLSSSSESMASEETSHEMRKTYRVKTSEKSQIKNRSPSPSTSSD